jgi:hypothetical protein
VLLKEYKYRKITLFHVIGLIGHGATGAMVIEEEAAFSV